MEFIESLSFMSALLFSGGIALVLSLGSGLIIFRRRKRRERVEQVKPVLAPAPAVVNTYMSASPGLENEAPGLAVRMAEVIDRLEGSVGSCLDACARLIEERPRILTAGLTNACRDTGSDIPRRVMAMGRSGAGEDEIAGQLSLDRELVRLYMHVGARENDR